MIVVSNTSPLTNLAAIGQFGLLKRLYGEVIIAEGVWRELNAGDKQWPGSADVAVSDWIGRRLAQDGALITTLERDLDRGEAETIALAIELKADVTLLDEREGRRAAQRLGLRVLGVVGILLAAKSRGFIQSVRPHLDALRQVAGFYIDDALYDHALSLAGEDKA